MLPRWNTSDFTSLLCLFVPALDAGGDGKFAVVCSILNKYFHQFRYLGAILHFGVDVNFFKPIIDNFSGFPYDTVYMIQGTVPLKDVKAGDKYHADVGDIFKLHTGIGEVGRKDRAIVADSALVVGIIRLLHFYVCFPSVPKDAFRVKDYGASLWIRPGILGCGFQYGEFWI